MFTHSLSCCCCAFRFHVISVCSPVPQTFQGRYIVTAVERDHENAVRQGSVGGVIAALVRHLQQHQPAMFTSSTTPKAPTPEARTVAKAALTKTPADAAKPLWSRITDETRFALAGSLACYLYSSYLSYPWLCVFACFSRLPFV